MNKKRQIQAEVAWLAKRAGLCRVCPRRGICSFHDTESCVGAAQLNKRIIYASQEFAAALGYTETGIIGVHSRRITAPFSWPLHIYQHECVNRWGFAEYSKWYVSKEGTLVAAHVTLRRGYDRGEPIDIGFINLMCPGVREAEHFRPVSYPRLIPV